MGGGGAGGNSGGSSGTAGTNGTGGGGGGSSSGALGGDGGKGIVIMRILTSQYTGVTTGSSPAPTVTTDGSYTVLKWTGIAYYTA